MSKYNDFDLDVQNVSAQYSIGDLSFNPKVACITRTADCRLKTIVCELKTNTCTIVGTKYCDSMWCTEPCTTHPLED